ncbi:MAG: type II toxin-antitoxin system HicB family antitoxin [Selenomonadaceae bacterium]|nr:type II toxin-antitoxin system HicB family antitoxin [Selenomonadaceae bacterium]
MMKCIYPAVFRWDEESKTYSVDFPDIEGCFTYGYSLPEAFDYAADVLNLMLSDAEICGDLIPTPSKIEDIKLDDKNSFAQYIYADTELYRDLLQLRKILEIKKRNKAKKFRKTA